MPLSAEDIQRAFAELSLELERRHLKAEIIVAGGAALVLLFGARASTKDVDAYFVHPEASRIREASEAVAERLDLPSDWLNDAALQVHVLDGARGFNCAATRDELAAWRDAVDRADARLLLSQMTGSADDIWRDVERFVPVHDRGKASYALEDLWESIRGSS